MRTGLTVAALSAIVAAGSCADPFLDGGDRVSRQRQASMVARGQYRQQMEMYAAEQAFAEREAEEQQEEQELLAREGPHASHPTASAPSWFGSPYATEAQHLDHHHGGNDGRVMGQQQQQQQQRGMMSSDLAALQTGLATGAEERTEGTRYAPGNRYDPEPHVNDAGNGVVANPYAVRNPVPMGLRSHHGVEPAIVAPPMQFRTGSDLTLPSYRHWTGYANPGQMDQMNMAARGSTGGNTPEPSLPTGHDRYNPVGDKAFYSGIAAAVTGVYNPSGVGFAGPTGDPHPWGIANPNENFFHAPSQMYDPLPGADEHVQLDHRFWTEQYTGRQAPAGPGLVGTEGAPVEDKTSKSDPAEVSTKAGYKPPTKARAPGKRSSRKHRKASKRGGKGKKKN